MYITIQILSIIYENVFKYLWNIICYPLSCRAWQKFALRTAPDPMQTTSILQRPAGKQEKCKCMPESHTTLTLK